MGPVQSVLFLMFRICLQLHLLHYLAQIEQCLLQGKLHCLKKKRNKPKQNNIITSPRKLPMLYPFEDIVSKDISDTSTEYDNFQHHNSQ